MPNLQSLFPNLQFEMPNCAFYHQLGILPVSSLLSFREVVQVQFFFHFPTNNNVNWTYGPKIEKHDTPPLSIYRRVIFCHVIADTKAQLSDLKGLS